MHGAGAAKCGTAAIFGAGETGMVADRPQKRHRRVDVEIEGPVVDGECRHRGILSGGIAYSNEKDLMRIIAQFSGRKNSNVRRARMRALHETQSIGPKRTNWG